MLVPWMEIILPDSTDCLFPCWMLKLREHFSICYTAATLQIMLVMLGRGHSVMSLFQCRVLNCKECISTQHPATALQSSQVPKRAGGLHVRHQVCRATRTYIKTLLECENVISRELQISETKSAPLLKKYLNFSNTLPQEFKCVSLSKFAIFQHY